MLLARLVLCLETVRHGPVGALSRSEIDEPVFTELDRLFSPRLIQSSHLPSNLRTPHGKQKVLHKDLCGLQYSMLNLV